VDGVVDEDVLELLVELVDEPGDGLRLPVLDDPDRRLPHGLDPEVVDLHDVGFPVVLARDRLRLVERDREVVLGGRRRLAARARVGRPRRGDEDEPDEAEHRHESEGDSRSAHVPSLHRARPSRMSLPLN
jgi:hypothetical protein